MTRNITTDESETGFALIEVVMAIVIVSAVMVVAIRTFSASALVQARSESQESATRQAATLLADLPNIQLTLGQTAAGSTVDGSSWRLTPTPTTSEIVVVELQIEDARGASATLTTARLRSELTLTGAD